MFFFKKRNSRGAEEKVTEENVTAVDEPADLDEAEKDAEWEEILTQDEGDGEMTELDDGRLFRRSFIDEIRALDAPDLRTILDEQKELYTPEEFAYIREVFAERLGDIH